jgi:hypothetical protein
VQQVQYLLSTKLHTHCITSHREAADNVLTSSLIKHFITLYKLHVQHKKLVYAPNVRLIVVAHTSQAALTIDHSAKVCAVRHKFCSYSMCDTQGSTHATAYCITLLHKGLSTYRSVV